jgi:hypothetical protein
MTGSFWWDLLLGIATALLQAWIALVIVLVIARPRDGLLREALLRLLPTYCAWFVGPHPTKLHHERSETEINRAARHSQPITAPGSAKRHPSGVSR